jgi:hypothetical protein
MLPASFFVSNELHSRNVTLPDGSVHALHFRELPAVEFRKFHLDEASDDDNKRADSMYRLISVSLVNPDGTPALTIQDARNLTGSAANSIMEAILDVNGFGKEKKTE